MSRSWNKFRMTALGFRMMEFAFILNLFQYPLTSCWTYFSIHHRHAEFISVSGLWVVKDEILKQVQDDGGWVQNDGVWVDTEFISVSTLVMLNLFQYPLSSCWIYFSIYSRHAEFISVSGLWVVKDEILKQVQDDGSWVQDDGVWVHAEFIPVSTLVMLNLFQYPLSSWWIYFSIWALNC